MIDQDPPPPPTYLSAESIISFVCATGRVTVESMACAQSAMRSSKHMLRCQKIVNVSSEHSFKSQDPCRKSFSLV